MTPESDEALQNIPSWKNTNYLIMIFRTKVTKILIYPGHRRKTQLSIHLTCQSKLRVVSQETPDSFKSYFGEFLYFIKTLEKF